LTRNRRRYIGLFLVSVAAWWIFEVINWRLQNWRYDGAELASTFGWVRRLGRGPLIRPDRKTTLFFFVSSLVMFGLMRVWPKLFFPFIWLSVYFILKPVNVWLGYRSLADWTKKGNWRPVVAL
jgi:hypothetical protein